MERRKKLVALALGILLLLGMLSSVALIFADAGHSCPGEGCPVCHEIQFCLQTLHPQSVTPFVPVLTLAVALFLAVCGVLSPVAMTHGTLISLKVKLSN